MRASPPILFRYVICSGEFGALKHSPKPNVLHCVSNLVLQKDRLMSETEVLPPTALPGAGKTVGVLALQGGVAEHARMLESLGTQVVLGCLPRSVYSIVSSDAMIAVPTQGSILSFLEAL